MLGDTNEHMGNSILSTPIPTDLSEDQKKIYKIEIGKIADPFIKKSIDSYKLVVERAQDLVVYNTAYKSAYDKLSMMPASDYYNKGEQASDSRVMNWLGE